MNKIKLLITIFILATLISGCKKIKPSNIENEVEKDVLDMNNIILNINNNEYKVVVENNDTVNELLNNMPLKLSVSELNGNEYYTYLNFNLKTNKENINNIKSGDIMLYENNCLVIFYESFNTTYRYTRIGHIENIDNLKEDLKSGNILLTSK